MPLYSDGEMLDLFTDQPNRKLYTRKEITLPGIKSFGWQNIKHAGMGTPRHYHKNCFEFHYIISGSISFSVDGQNYTVKGGDVFVTYPNEFHGSGNEPFTIHKLYWFTLSHTENVLNLKEDWSDYLQQNLLHLNRIIPVGREMGELLAGVYQNILEKEEGKQRLASAQMLLFLHRMIEYNQALQSKSCSRSISKALTFIEHNKHRSITLEEAAETCGLSLSHFKHKFKTEMGITPAEYILQARVECAKELLKAGRSVTEAAYELDFSSSNYFSVVFRRVTSVTPSQYIRRHRSE